MLAESPLTQEPFLRKNCSSWADAEGEAVPDIDSSEDFPQINFSHDARNGTDFPQPPPPCLRISWES